MMLEDLPLSRQELLSLIKIAPHSYKLYEIPKRSGGTRTIAQPSKSTKFLQYWLIENIFKKLPLHQSAMAYVSGGSIRKNAEQHSHNPYITKFDFKDFFVSIKGADIKEHAVHWLSNELGEEDLNIIERLSCIKRKGSERYSLSIGSPSSPLLSNSIMFAFDTYVNDWSVKNQVIYTRYADDMCFSSNIKGKSFEIEGVIREALRSISYPKLRLNHKKTTHLSKKHQRRITGLVISNEGDVSLGRTRKRILSSLVHKYKLGLLNKDSVSNLQGYLAFAQDVEPSFLKRLANKYGQESIDQILSSVDKTHSFFGS
ncbi:retron St85 family RNA-directed DNA polymerase [Methylophaga sp.]|jgi:retron-type reverse transcriptase|uniref:retron St85 family RNA-directed DNA polymerase n=1 Tax=Methylophaga sp. TaxID=2024840 RepID=UPI003F7215C1